MATIFTHLSRLLRPAFLLSFMTLVALLPYPAVAGDREDADAAFQEEDWQVASQAYERVVAKNPKDARAWFRLGRCRQSQGEAESAIEAYDQSESAGFPRQFVLFEKARSHGSLEAREQATALLDEAGSLGKSRRVAELLASATELAFLDESGALEGLVSRFTPCSEAPYRQFDFWLGNWKVEAPKGSEVGRNEVTSFLGGCMIMESWTSITGQEGMSFNYYDSGDESWHQIYLDNTGNVGQWPPIKGGLIEGVMVLESAMESGTQSRWRWQKIGVASVRQWAELTKDGGETWNTVWDSVYVLDPDS